MIVPLSNADILFGKRVLYYTNCVTAVVGGLAMIFSVAAPFSMMMTEWASFTDAVLTAVICGGIPLACVASVIVSRWVFRRGWWTIAIVIAGAPLFLLVAWIAADMMSLL